MMSRTFPRQRLLLALLLVAHVIVVWRQLDLSIWSDEASSVWFAQMSPLALVRELCDPHPPAYYLFLHYWMEGGREAAWLRLPSLLASLLAGMFTYRWGRSLGGTRVALIAAAVLLLHPLQIWYAAEVRMYALVALFSVAAAWFAWQIWFFRTSTNSVEAPKRTTILLYWLTTTTAFWLDYTAFLAFGLLQLLWLAANRPRQRLWLIVQATILLPTLTYWFSADQFAGLGQSYQPVFIAVRANQIGVPLTPESAGLLLRIGVIGFVIVALVVASLWPRLQHNQLLQRAIPILFIIGWLTLLLLSAFPRAFTVKRLLIVFLPHLALGTAYFLARWKTTIAVAVILLSTLIVIFLLPTHQKEPWQSVVNEQLPTLIEPNSTVWVDEIIVPPFAFYADDQWAWTPLMVSDFPSLPHADDSLVLVTTNNPYRNLPSLLPQTFLEEYEMVTQVEDVGVLLIHYQRRAEPMTDIVLPEAEPWGLLLPSPLATCR